MRFPLSFFLKSISTLCFCWYTMILLRLNDNPLTVVFKHTTSEFCCLISFSLWESFIFFSLHSTSLFSNLLDYVQLLLLIRMLTGRLCLVLFCFIPFSFNISVQSNHYQIQPLFCFIAKLEPEWFWQLIKPYISPKNHFLAVVWNCLNATEKLHYVIHCQRPCPYFHYYLPLRNQW